MSEYLLYQINKLTDTKVITGPSQPDPGLSFQVSDSSTKGTHFGFFNLLEDQKIEILESKWRELQLRDLSPFGKRDHGQLVDSQVVTANFTLEQRNQNSGKKSRVIQQRKTQNNCQLFQFQTKFGRNVSGSVFDRQEAGQDQQGGQDIQGANNGSGDLQGRNLCDTGVISQVKNEQISEENNVTIKIEDKQNKNIHKKVNKIQIQQQKQQSPSQNEQITPQQQQQQTQDLPPITIQSPPLPVPPQEQNTSQQQRSNDPYIEVVDQKELEVKKASNLAVLFEIQTEHQVIEKDCAELTARSRSRQNSFLIQKDSVGNLSQGSHYRNKSVTGENVQFIEVRIEHLTPQKVESRIDSLLVQQMSLQSPLSKMRYVSERRCLVNNGQFQKEQQDFDLNIKGVQRQERQGNLKARSHQVELPESQCFRTYDESYRDFQDIIQQTKRSLQMQLSSLNGLQQSQNSQEIREYNQKNHQENQEGSQGVSDLNNNKNTNDENINDNLMVDLEQKDLNQRQNQNLIQNQSLSDNPHQYSQKETKEEMKEETKENQIKKADVFKNGFKDSISQIQKVRSSSDNLADCLSPEPKNRASQNDIQDDLNNEVSADYNENDRTDTNVLESIKQQGGLGSFGKSGTSAFISQLNQDQENQDFNQEQDEQEQLNVQNSKLVQQQMYQQEFYDQEEQDQDQIDEINRNQCQNSLGLQQQLYQQQQYDNDDINGNAYHGINNFNDQQEDQMFIEGVNHHQQQAYPIDSQLQTLQQPDFYSQNYQQNPLKNPKKSAKKSSKKVLHSNKKKQQTKAQLFNNQLLKDQNHQQSPNQYQNIHKKSLKSDQNELIKQSIKQSNKQDTKSDIKSVKKQSSKKASNMKKKVTKSTKPDEGLSISTHQIAVSVSKISQGQDLGFERRYDIGLERGYDRGYVQRHRDKMMINEALTYEAEELNRKICDSKLRVRQKLGQIGGQGNRQQIDVQSMDQNIQNVVNVQSVQNNLDQLNDFNGQKENKGQDLVQNSDQSHGNNRQLNMSEKYVARKLKSKRQSNQKSGNRALPKERKMLRVVGLRTEPGFFNKTKHDQPISMEQQNQQIQGQNKNKSHEKELQNPIKNKKNSPKNDPKSPEQKAYEFYETQMHSLKQKQALSQIIKKQRDQQQIEECTFQPNLLHKQKKAQQQLQKELKAEQQRKDQFTIPDIQEAINALKDFTSQKTNKNKNLQIPQTQLNFIQTNNSFTNSNLNNFNDSNFNDFNSTSNIQNSSYLDNNNEHPAMSSYHECHQIQEKQVNQQFQEKQDQNDDIKTLSDFHFALEPYRVKIDYQSRLDGFRRNKVTGVNHVVRNDKEIRQFDGHQDFKRNSKIDFQQGFGEGKSQGKGRGSKEFRDNPMSRQVQKVIAQDYQSQGNLRRDSLDRSQDAKELKGMETLKTIQGSCSGRKQNGPVFRHIKIGDVQRQKKACFL